MHWKYWMSQIVQKCIHLKTTTDLTSMFPTIVDCIDTKMNDRNEVLRWAYKIYDMIITISKVYSIKNNNCSYLDVTDGGQLNQRNNELEWWIMNVSASKIWNESNHEKIILNWNKQLLLPLCSWQWLVESAKQWMWVMKY